MENWISTSVASQYIDLFKKNWFKITLGLLLLFIFLKKDLSFSINLNSPSIDAQEAPVYQDGNSKESKRPTYTEVQSKKTTGQKTILERMGLATIGKGNASSPTSELATVALPIQEAYIRRFAHVAQAEQAKFGIPASITVASGLLHSAAGTRDMARLGNNHFALPCTSDWTGESGAYNDACYRHYESAWTSFRDHSLYLSSGKMKSLARLKGKNYKVWAKALAKLGFSAQSRLDQQLVKIIEQFNLNQLDQK